MKNPIFVETTINSNLDTVWEHSQNPDIHTTWDLRFSSITYENKRDHRGWELFRYTRSVFPGLLVKGWGANTGKKTLKNGGTISSLEFGSEQLLSPIKKGSGYWKYTPLEEGVKFETQYTYEVRYGFFGRILDLLFRPTIAWATALSFDVFRLSIETNQKAEQLYRAFFMKWIFAFTFLTVWLYHGLVPKVIAQHPEEVRMIERVLPIDGTGIVIVVGVLEIVFGLLWLKSTLHKWLFLIQLVAFPGLAVGALVANPALLTDPFSPISLTIVLCGASLVGYINEKQTIPSSKNTTWKVG